MPKPALHNEPVNGFDAALRAFSHGAPVPESVGGMVAALSTLSRFPNPSDEQSVEAASRAYVEACEPGAWAGYCKSKKSCVCAGMRRVLRELDREGPATSH